jgi:hypothetical protein
VYNKRKMKIEKSRTSQKARKPGTYRTRRVTKAKSDKQFGEFENPTLQ